MRDLTDLLVRSKTELLVHLAEVTSELAARAEEIGMVRAQERRAKVEGYQTSEASTHSGRDRDASAVAVELSATLFELEGQYQGLLHERDLILAVLGQ